MICTYYCKHEGAKTRRHKDAYILCRVFVPLYLRVYNRLTINSALQIKKRIKIHINILQIKK
jgi:hypothetical protein